MKDCKLGEKLGRKLIFITCDFGIILNSPEMKGWMIRQLNNVESLMAWNFWSENLVPHLYSSLLSEKVKETLVNRTAGRY